MVQKQTAMVTINDEKTMSLINELGTQEDRPASNAARRLVLLGYHCWKKGLVGSVTENVSPNNSIEAAGGQA